MAGDAAPDGRTTAPSAASGAIVDGATRSSSRAARRGRATAGPSTARDLDDGLPRDKEHWGWNWSETRKALDYLYMVGDLAIAGRNSQFEVLYDLPERVLPAEVLAAPDADAARRPTASWSAGPRASHGVATAQCLARLLPDARRATPRPRGRRTLVEDGRAAAGRGSRAGSGRPTSTATPACRAGSSARALLSPFDPVVWERERTEQLFDFHYRIEIYVPAPQAGARLLRAAVPARRPDRRPGRPQGRPQGGPAAWCKAAYAEPDAPPEDRRGAVGRAARLAGWLGADDITVEPRGDLAPAARALV